PVPGPRRRRRHAAPRRAARIDRAAWSRRARSSTRSSGRARLRAGTRGSHGGALQDGQTAFAHVARGGQRQPEVAPMVEQRGGKHEHARRRELTGEFEVVPPVGRPHVQKQRGIGRGDFIARFAQERYRPDTPLVEPREIEEHTSELQSPCNLVCRLLLEKKKKKNQN